MFLFAGVFVVLALANQGARSQPTYDVSGCEDRIFHWKDARDLLEEMATNLRHIVAHHEERTKRLEESAGRLERLEQMLNESSEGQRRLETQVRQLQQQRVNDANNHNARYASLHHLYNHHQQQQLSISSSIDNITAKLEVVSGGVNAVRDIVDSIKQRPTDEVISRDLIAEFRTLPARLADAQQAMLASYDQKRQNESAEQLEMIAASIRPVREGQSQIVDMIEEKVPTNMKNEVINVLNDLAANASQKFAEIDDEFKAIRELSLRNSDLCRGQIESMMHVGNASLDKLADVAQQIHTQQLQQQARGETFLGNVIEMTNGAAQSLLTKLEEIHRNVSENVNRVLANISRSRDRQRTMFERVEEQANASASMIQQGQSRLVDFITSDLYQEVQVLKVAALESRELIANNLSLQLKDAQESCSRAVGNGFGDVVRSQTQLLQSNKFELYQEALLSNMTKLLEDAHAEMAKRSENMTCEAVTVALTNITTHFGEMLTRQRLSEICFTGGDIVGIVNNLTQIQQQLFVEVGERMERKTNESLVLIEISRAEILAEIADRSDEIESQLTRVEGVAQRRNESDLLYNGVGNLAVMLTEIEGSCASIAGNISNGDSMLAQSLQRTTTNVLHNTRLLRDINQTWMRSTEQLRQQYNGAVGNITTQLVAIRDMLTDRSTFIICLRQGSYAFMCFCVCLSVSIRTLLIYCMLFYSLCIYSFCLFPFL